MGLVSGLLLILVAANFLHPSIPDSGGASPAVDDLISPTAEMSMLYRKGFLFIRVDVLSLDVGFGSESGERIRDLANHGETDPGVADSIAAAAIQSRDALIRIEFRRDIDLDRFIDEARKATEKVWKSGVIDEDEYRRVQRGLPSWYQSLRGRGIRQGDRMFYRIQGDRLHTVFEGSDGQIFVDQVDTGSGPRLSVLGGYFVRGSDFREQLIESLTRRHDEE